MSSSEKTPTTDFENLQKVKEKSFLRRNAANLIAKVGWVAAATAIFLMIKNAIDDVNIPSSTTKKLSSKKVAPSKRANIKHKPNVKINYKNGFPIVTENPTSEEIEKIQTPTDAIELLFKKGASGEFSLAGSDSECRMPTSTFEISIHNSKSNEVGAEIPYLLRPYLLENSQLLNSFGDFNPRNLDRVRISPMIGDYQECHFTSKEYQGRTNSEYNLPPIFKNAKTLGIILNHNQIYLTYKPKNGKIGPGLLIDLQILQKYAPHLHPQIIDSGVFDSSSNQIEIPVNDFLKEIFKATPSPKQKKQNNPYRKHRRYQTPPSFTSTTDQNFVQPQRSIRNYYKHRG